MIGLGQQYLTAAGFGRFRITAASLGNLLMLGTFRWLTAATMRAILGAFGDDGKAVIKATNEYLNGIAASDRDKATALAGFINQHPLDAALYGGLYVQDGLVFQMDRAYECTAAKWTDFIGGVEFNGTNVQIVDDVPYFNGSAYFKNEEAIPYVCEGHTIEISYLLNSSNQPFLFDNSITGGLMVKIYSTDRYFINHTRMQGFKCNAQVGELMTFGANTNIGCENGNVVARYGSDWYGLESGASIGARANASAFLTGKIYGIRIYNRLLTEAEILANQDIDLKRFNLTP